MIDEATAAAIYEILVVECGAIASEFSDLGFARYLGSDAKFGSKEWRFRGHLGFGGKLRIGHSIGVLGQPHWYVDAYPEDMTPARERMIRRANERLERLRKETERVKTASR